MASTIESFAEESIAGNKVVFALSMAWMGDAIGNSIHFIIIPLNVFQAGQFFSLTFRYQDPGPADVTRV